MTTIPDHVGRERTVKTPEQIAAGTDFAQDALNRMRRAEQRGTGCHLTADMIASLNNTMVGQMWAEADPRAILQEQADAK